MPLDALLGATIAKSDGAQIDVASLAKKKTCLLYFSAHWCPPCRGFTPKLNAAYSEYKSKVGDDAEAELVFVSWDNTEEEFNDYHKEMAFPAIPYNEELRSKLGPKFGVQGIPSLVALDSEGEVLHSKDSGVDLRSLIDKHGADAFPLSVERVAELKVLAAEKAAVALKQLGDGSVAFAIKAPDGREVTLNDLLSTHEHVGLMLGDGDGSDATYKEVASIIESVNGDSAARQACVYLGWDLYQGGDHAPFAEKYHSVLEVSDGLRAVVDAIANSPGPMSFVNLRRGSDDVPVLVMTDPGGFALLRQGGAAAYPWSESKMAELAAAAEQRLETLKELQTNFAFFKGESGEDSQLVRTKGSAPTAADLVALGDDAVVGLYFSGHWCPPCRGFTPELVKCYETLKAAGKKFEVVFVSSDRDQASFAEYFDSMVTSAGDQLCALRYENRQLKGDLNKLFEVSGIPTLVLLKANGELITKNGREAVSYGADYFPWDPAALQRGAAEAEARAAARAKAAVDKERDDAAAQRAAGDVLVERLVGPALGMEHDITAKTLKFKGFLTVGAPEALATSGEIYYEIEVLGTEGVPQIGFALKDGIVRSDESASDGCGDDAKSWGLDGARQTKWWNGEAAWACGWAVGDVVGLAANVDAGKIAVSKNGAWAGEACGVIWEDETIKEGVYPCLTASGYAVRYAFKDFKHAAPTPEVWASAPVVA